MTTTRRRNALSVQEALELGEAEVKNSKGYIPHCFSGYHVITVRNEACYSEFENTNAWYETDFISSFAALIAYKNHVGSIQFVHCLLQMEKVESQLCKRLKVNVKRVVSVFHGNDHFAVMESNLDTKCQCHNNL